MQYRPLVRSMNRVGAAPLGGGHTAVMFDGIKAFGTIEYAFILAVYDDATREPVYFVTSEVNAMAKELGGGSHFLCAFDGPRHVNMGASDEWADPEKFFPEALRIAAEWVGAARS
ncbi:MAG TPA: hypothetical protein VK002_09660 [Rubricoccaceae bacterium]|nr:hypothetical protein [Rubricoccaceae bacterium]